MGDKLQDIYNRKEHSSQEFYDAFNSFIFSNDRRVIGKLIYRNNFFDKIKHLPGDIVEIGVFKGSGIATWCKLMDIFIPHTCKTVIGFDLFDSSDKNEILNTYNCGEIMKTVTGRSPSSELTKESVTARLLSANIAPSKFLLVEGNVSLTSLEFVKTNPGFRISLLYLDLDLDEPTYDALCNFWDRVVPGGYIVFDEYEYHKFDESNGVDRFLKDKKLYYNLVSTNFYAPTAYIIKSE
jgi:hypothetical protein